MDWFLGWGTSFSNIFWVNSLAFEISNNPKRIIGDTITDTSLSEKHFRPWRGKDWKRKKRVQLWLFISFQSCWWHFMHGPTLWLEGRRLIININSRYSTCEGWRGNLWACGLLAGKNKWLVIEFETLILKRCMSAADCLTCSFPNRISISLELQQTEPQVEKSIKKLKKSVRWLSWWCFCV